MTHTLDQLRVITARSLANTSLHFPAGLNSTLGQIVFYAEASQKSTLEDVLSFVPAKSVDQIEATDEFLNIVFNLG